MTSSDKARSSKRTSPKSNTNALAVVEVPFHGDTLQAVRDGDRVMVNIRRVCDAFGVSEQGQLAKLKTREWATIKMIFTVAEDGKTREIAFLDLDSLPSWLTSIEPSKVKPTVRTKLIEYQRECAKVLRDYFFAGGAINPRANEDQLAALMAKIDEQTKNVQLLQSKLHVQNDQIARLTWMVENDNGLAGPAGTSLNQRITKIAHLLHPVGANKSQKAKIRSRIETDVREHVGYPRYKCYKWENMARSLCAKANLRLDILEAEAREQIAARASALQTVMRILESA